MSNEVQDEIISLELTPVKELFYNGAFGIYGCETDETDKVQLNKFNNFTINGQMPKLTLNTAYKAKLIERYTEKYGLGYEVKEVRQDRPQTIQEQHAYIKTMIGEEIANRIIAKYPKHDLLAMFQNDEIEYADIKGIGDKTYKKIKYILLNHLEIQEALVKLLPLGVTFKKLSKLIDHYGDVSILMQKIEENVYCLCEVEGIGFKTVDQYALVSGVEKESEYRIEAGVDYTLQQAENFGHSYLEIDTLITESNKNLKIYEHHIELYITGLQEKKQNKFYVTKDIIALYKNYFYEKQIAELLKELDSVESKVKTHNVDAKIKEIEEQQGFEFTDEQRKAIYTSVEKNVIVISGKAGTGKSSVLKGILAVLDNLTYETCALSGKAAMRIVESGLQSQTIHRLLGFNPSGGFLHNINNKLQTGIVVLDEGGMVGSGLFYSLISAIEKGTKFIIVGDMGQLAPIGAGNIFKDIINSGTVTVCELTQVQRQALKSGILYCANEIREGRQIVDSGQHSKQVYGELNDFHLYPIQNAEYILDNIIEICKRYKANIMDFQVVVAQKKRGKLSAHNINIELQQIFNPDDYGIEMKRGETVFKINDKIIHNGNNYEINVFNGQMGRIVDIETRDQSKIMKIQFENMQNVIEYEQSDMDKIDLAYAITCHRGQGSGWRNVLIALDYSSYMLLNRQWVYTALTRAVKTCVMVTESRALRHAIKTNDSSKRNTFLIDILRSRGDQ